MLDCEPVGIGESAAHVGFALYPNPCAGRCWVEIPNGSSARNLRVIDVIRRLHYQQPVIGGSRLQLELSSLPAGVYLVQVGQGAERLVVR